MDNYEINILRRGGNWKKVKPDDLIIDETNSELNENYELNSQKSDNDFISFLSKVNLIISRLETLENEKNQLKKELKTYEDVFLKKKKMADDEISKIYQEKEIIEKTINVIKSLKSF